MSQIKEAPLPQADAAQADNAVVVRNISKNYGKVQALENLSLEFPRGQLTSLLGPSGCGKTTLLKIIAGLLEPSSGAVEIDGKTVTGPGDDRAFVFQDFALLPWATVLRNVAFGLELRGVAKSEREDIAARYIADVGLKGFEQSYPHELSGGMRQRVGLARALSVDAQVLLMDEPFSAVDEQTRRKFQEDLLSLVQHENKTFIFVTHSIEEAVYVSDQIAILLPHPPVKLPRQRRGQHPPRSRISRHSRRDLGLAAHLCGIGSPHDVTWIQTTGHVIPADLGIALGNRGSTWGHLFHSTPVRGSDHAFWRHRHARFPKSTERNRLCLLFRRLFRHRNRGSNRHPDGQKPTAG